MRSAPTTKTITLICRAHFLPTRSVTRDGQFLDGHHLVGLEPTEKAEESPEKSTSLECRGDITGDTCRRRSCDAEIFLETRSSNGCPDKGRVITKPAEV